jgi:two-component system LytT family response regulator
MNTIIVDDEIKAIDLLDYHLTEFFDDFNIVGRYKNINNALEHILKNKPDVIFLDINMPNGTGLELLEQIKDKNILTILVTAHQEYAIDAIKLSAFDYLLKPINISELNRVHSKLVNNFTHKNIETKDLKIKIKVSTKHYLFDSFEIYHISSEGNYSTIYSKVQKPLIISKNLKKVETEYFSVRPFFRCHQSHIININHIKEYTNIEILLTNGKKIPFSSKRYLEFTKL